MATREEKIKARQARLNTMVDQRYERHELRGPNKELRSKKWELIKSFHNGSVSVLKYIFDAWATPNPMGEAYGAFLTPTDLISMSVAFRMHIDSNDSMQSGSSDNDGSGVGNGSTSTLHSQHVVQKSI